MTVVLSLRNLLLQTVPPIEQRVMPAIGIGAIIALALLGWSVAKKNKGGIAAGSLLLIGLLFAYSRYLSPYSTQIGTMLAVSSITLFKIGDYAFTTGALGAIAVLVLVIVLLAWYGKRAKSV